MKLYLHAIVASSMMASGSLAHATITISGANVVGFDSTTAAIVDNSGSVLTVGVGYVAIGTFDALTDVEIQSLTNGSSIDNEFGLLASTTMGTGPSLDGLWDFSFEKTGDTSSLANKTIFTVIGNGADLPSSSQFLIYRHSDLNGGTGAFRDDSSADPNEKAIVGAGASSTGSVVVGAYGNYQYDFGAGAFDAFNLVTIPEPSSLALLGLGVVGFTLRRRR